MSKCLESRRQGALLFILALVLAPLPLLATMEAPTAQPSDPILLIAMPWTDPRAEVEAAGGAIIGPVRAPFGVFVYSDAPDFAEKLGAQGFWTMQATTLVRIFCGVPT